MNEDLIDDMVTHITNTATLCECNLRPDERIEFWGRALTALTKRVRDQQQDYAMSPHHHLPVSH